MANEIEAGQDGLFSICVFNAEDCSDDELNDTFGKFGPIAKISRVSNIVFIRYQTLEEATKCYEGMQGHEKFNVRPGKKKGGQNGVVRNKENRFGEMSRCDNSRGRRSEINGNSGSFGHANSVAGATQSSPLPKMIPFPARPAEEAGTKEKPTAKIVFIGNINPAMGQDTIYQLCNKTQTPPLHVAMKTMKRPPYPALSCALVYVRNENEVSNVVNALDNLVINRYELFVCPLEKMREAGRSLFNAKQQ